MALRLEWTERAIIHLEELLNYWEDRNASKTYSLKLYSWIQTALKLLSYYPKSGRKTDNKRLFKKTVKDYFIYYTFDTNTLTIIAIIDIRRDPEYLKKFENIKIRH
ncbi:MAG TPA: type II toxin-antitoxin system RelE/ParE family toxin [Saprospirales bacterium]|mgnify:CR=1 FL=1|nr:type II toxin-antitoxin system RelE/ParE family toxin [Saprospirales bacterium]HAY70714.1 type II toxin-antitoxin system RelE/ParE family toxin [Saprospirales bacterium]HRQ28902.1 type II toxin-antitoxin system RelE/ParE family toxin [Saprospiraceae bacterium]